MVAVKEEFISNLAVQMQWKNDGSTCNRQQSNRASVETKESELELAPVQPPRSLNTEYVFERDQSESLQEDEVHLDVSYDQLLQKPTYVLMVSVLRSFEMHA